MTASRPAPCGPATTRDDMPTPSPSLQLPRNGFARSPQENTCFLNAGVMMMVGTTTLQSTLRSPATGEQSNLVYEALFQDVQNLFATTVGVPPKLTETISTLPLVNALIDHTRQQDAHESLIRILELLPPQNPIRTSTQVREKKTGECLDCGIQTPITSVVDSNYVSLPSDRYLPGVSSGLAWLEDKEKVSRICPLKESSGCSSDESFVKSSFEISSTLLVQLPLYRVDRPTGATSKGSTREMIIDNEIVFGGRKLRLASVIAHHGSLTLGHYITFAVTGDKMVVCYDDGEVGTLYPNLTEALLKTGSPDPFVVAYEALEVQPLSLPTSKDASDPHQRANPKPSSSSKPTSNLFPPPHFPPSVRELALPTFALLSSPPAALPNSQSAPFATSQLDPPQPAPPPPSALEVMTRLNQHPDSKKPWASLGRLDLPLEIFDVVLSHLSGPQLLDARLISRFTNQAVKTFAWKSAPRPPSSSTQIPLNGIPTASSLTSTDRITAGLDALRLDPSKSDYLAHVSPHVLSGTVLKDLFSALGNTNLTETMRLAAAAELVRRARGKGKIWTSPSITPAPMSVQPLSPRAHSPLPSNKSVVYVMSEDGKDGNGMEITMSRGKTGKMLIEVASDGGSIVFGGSDVVMEDGDDGPGTVAPAFSMTPVEASRRIATRVLPKALLQQSRSPLIGGFNRKWTTEASIQLYPRPPLPLEVRMDIAASVVIWHDFVFAQRRRIPSHQTFKFVPADSRILTQPEQDSLSKSELASLLEKRLSSSALILGRSCSVYSAKCKGMTPADQSIAGQGPRVDWDQVRTALPPGSSAIIKLVDDLEDEFGDKQVRSACNRAVPVGLNEASRRVAEYEASSLVWHRLQPVDLGPGRTYEAVNSHPEFAKTLQTMHDEVYDAFLQVESRNPNAKVSLLEIRHMIGSPFERELWRALKAAQKSVNGLLPVTDNLDFGTDDSYYKNASVGQNFWVPHVKKWKDVEVPKIRKEVCERLKEKGLGAKESEFRWRPDRHGILRFAGATDRTLGDAFALSDGQDLAATASLLQAASRSDLLTASIPTLHEDVDDVKDAKDVGGGTKTVRIETHNSLDRVASRFIADIYTELVRPIVHFSHEGLLDPTRPFYEGGRSTMKRPENYEDGHGAEGYESKGVTARHVLSAGGLVDVYFEDGFKACNNLSLLHLDLLDAEPTEAPEKGSSLPEAARRTTAFDAEMPWNRSKTLRSQGEWLLVQLDGLRDSPERLHALKEILKELKKASGGLTGNKSFGKKLHARSSMDSVFLLKDILMKLMELEIVELYQLQALWEFTLTTLGLAMMSVRPASFSLVIMAFIDGLSLKNNSAVDVDRLEHLFEQYQQQFTAALIGLVWHTDSLRWAEQSAGKDQALEIRTFAVLADIAVHRGICPGCAKATWALEEYIPTVGGRGGERQLSWTTIGHYRAVDPDVWKKEEIAELWRGWERGKAVSMMPCLVTHELRGMSLAARVVDKNVTALTHLGDKVGRFRHTGLASILRRTLEDQDV